MKTFCDVITRMSGPTIKPRALRSLLDAVLRTDSDLNAFCLDYFPGCIGSSLPE